MKLKICLALFIILSVFIDLVPAEPVPKRGGVLVIGQNTDAVSLDPAKMLEVESAKVIGNLFEGLVRYVEDSADVEPALAVSWETMQQGREWVFHLRKGVRFHDGTPFNARAVVFSFLRQIDPDHPFFEKNFGYAGFTFKYVETVEAVDDHTVRIRLEKPYAPFLYNLAMHGAAPIISPSAMKKWGADFEKHPVGTGPFKFVEWVPNERIVLAANPDFRDPPYLDKVIFRVIRGQAARFQAFQTKRIHVMDGISPADISGISQLPDGELFRQPGWNVGYLAMNTEKAPFDRVKVRRAVNHAIHKQSLVKLYYKNLAIPATNPIPPTLWGYNDNIEGYAYDPQKAMRLLKEAGYEGGFSRTLLVMDTARPYMPQPLKIARAIKGNLAAVGITVRVESHPWNTYLAKIKNGEHDMCLIGWVGDNGDPDNFLYVLLDQDNAVKPNALNQTFFRHGPLHDLLIKAQQISNRKERIRLYHKAQEIIHQQAPWVPLAHVQQINAYQRDIHGIVFHPTGIARLQRVWME